jgi:putative ABC transport system permease protein
VKLLPFITRLRSSLWCIRAIVIRSLRQHLLATAVTVTSVALGGGLLMAVYVLRAQSLDAFTSGSQGFDAVLGARGSQLQLVLSSLFHLESSTGNLPWSVYRSIADQPSVQRAIPLTVGDNFRGHRIVGTTPDLFTDHPYAPGRHFTIAPGGRLFDPLKFEAVLGASAARATGLKLGDTFNTYHGLKFDEAAAHDDTYTVVGILQPTNTPADRAIWVPLESYYRLAGHSLMGTGEKYVPTPGLAIPDEHKEVSAVLLKFRSPQAGFSLSQTINRQGRVATLAWPIGLILADLFGKLIWVDRVLALVAQLIVLVAAGTILASIYNTMNERRREFAILRALGAGRRTVMSAIIVQASVIAGLGAVVGYVFYFSLIWAAMFVIRSQTGVVIDPLGYHPILWITPPAMLALGAVAGIVPALKAYSTDVAANLAPST